MVTEWLTPKRLRDYGLQSERLLWPTKGPSHFEEELGAEELEQRARDDDAREGRALGADEVDVAGHVRPRLLRDRDDVDRLGRYDIARFGMEAFRSSPRQADLLIVSGRSRTRWRRRCARSTTRCSSRSG